MKKFTVVDTASNSVKTFETNAETVGELKQELNKLGISTVGMTIQEGITKTEYGSDDSVRLPHDVPYRGGTTNNLVFRVTAANKRIRSGMDRAEAYQKVKELGLAEAIKEETGRNFTQVSTNDLEVFIVDAEEALAEREARETPYERVDNTPSCPMRDAISLIAQALYNAGIMDEETVHALRVLSGLEIKPNTPSVEEIAEMFKDM